MTSILVIAGFGYLLSIVAVALMAHQALASSRPVFYDDYRGLIPITVGFALFFSGFTYPGLLAVIAGLPLLSINTALGILAAVFLAAMLVFWASEQRIIWPGIWRNYWSGWSMHDRQANIIGLTGLLVFATLAILLVLGYPRGFEVTAYHLPIAVNIYQNGTLALWDHAYMHAYPANMSVWSGFWLQVLPERLVSVVNLPFLALLVYAVYVLARQVGSDRNVAMLLAIGLISVPIFGFSAIELGSDVAGVAFLVSAVVLALASDQGDRQLALLSGVAAGMAFGFKSLHLVGSALLGIFIFAGIARQASLGVRPWGSLDVGRGLSFGIGFLLLAGPWLARNWWEFGNPLYPVHFGALFDAFGFTAAADFILAERATTQYEWVRKSIEWIFYPWIEWHFIDQNFKHSSGLGAFFAATIPVAWFTWLALLVLLVLRRHDHSNANADMLRMIWPGFICFLIGTGIFVVWAILVDRQPRYYMGGIPLLMVLYGPLLVWANLRWKKIGFIVLSSAAAVMLGILIISLAVRQASYLRMWSLPTRADFYEYPVEIDKLPAGTVIANFGPRVWHYALYGKNLSNHVIPSTLIESRITQVNGAWGLTAQNISQLGMTHFFIDGEIKSEKNFCVELKEIGALRRNPYNGLLLSSPRIIYQINVRCPFDILHIKKSLNSP